MVKHEPAVIPQRGSLEIQVEKTVVKHLSIGLYRNYALAIKELISNAYDAGATQVKIKLDLKGRRIVVRDNGRGMDYNEFKNEYLHIGYYKPPPKKPDELGRMRIGTFGIGFLAPLPYCKRMVVMTKKRGGDSVLRATINAANFFSAGNWDVKEERVPYEIMKSDLPREEGETIIILEEIQPQIVEDLKRDSKNAKAKIDQLGGFEKFKWTLAQYCPLDFPPPWKQLQDFFETPQRVPMRLWLDGRELFRNVPSGCEILELAEKTFGNIQVKYVIMTPYRTVRPEEARGLQLRLRDVAVGFPRSFDVTKLGRVLGRLNCLCGEVHVTKGLDDSLMVNRDSFNYTEDVAGLYDFFRRKLTAWNDKLVDQAGADKGVYEALPADALDSVAEQLRKAGVVKFPKERFRLPTSARAGGGKGNAAAPAQRLKGALAARPDITVVSSKARRSRDQAPIEVDSKRKSITVYDEHPSFSESVTLENREILVSYDQWDPRQTPCSICRYDRKHNRATFNMQHPLFQSKVSHKIIKPLSLGILLILERTDDRDRLVARFNRLLEDVFQW
jgi:hypothetical protein